jgi:hypothetical protein
MNTATQNSGLVLDDLDKPIRGARAIAAAMGDVQTLQQTFYALEHGLIPADKNGRIWQTTLRRLRNHTNGSPTIDNALANTPKVITPTVKRAVPATADSPKVV